MLRTCILFVILMLFPERAFPGAWSRETGLLNIKLAYFSLVTDERFSTGGGLESRCLIDPSPGCFRQALDSGIRIPVFGDIEGAVRSRALFFTTELGMFDRFELVAQIGYFSSENDFEASVPQSISTQSKGFSDLRVNLKYQYLGHDQFAAAISAGFKAPTGKFTPNAFGVSLGEGGWDYQITHDFGISFWPLPLYANVMLGYRWRDRNQAGIDFGDEFLYNLEAGFNLHAKIMFKLAVHGLNAEADRQFLGIGRSKSPGREINFLSVSLFYSLADFEFELGGEHSLSGQNYISGTKMMVAMSRSFELFK